MAGRSRGGSFKGNKRGPRTQRRDFRDGRENVWKKSRAHNASSGEAGVEPAPGWAAFVKESPAFELYYKKQCIVHEKEWKELISTLQKPLPTTFRINGSGQFAYDIRDQMQRDFFDYLKDVTELDGEHMEPVRPLLWYPNKLAWNLNFSRTQLRKMPILGRIHDFLKQENEIGSITRQEAVSMLPPLFLDVRPYHRVLDMCAAPGSKTFQLLEMIHKDDEPGVPSNGLVIANDVDSQRCHLLIHQTKRMCSSNILVTNHEAQHFPGLKHQKVAATSEKQEDPLSEIEKGLWFDRILCDVPCSGDGTIRKAPDIWRKWNVGIGNGLHRLQIQIAMRGVALLRLGGRLVYSTCSLNPVENEAVVSEILRQSKGSMELLDVSSKLPDLKRRPGLLTWKVRDKGKWFASYSQVNRHRAGSVVPGMFPSGKGCTNVELVENKITVDVSADTLSTAEAAEVGESAIDIVEEDLGSDLEGEGEVSDFPLDRCIRILPHDQDTGGFFVAVFEKVQPFNCVVRSVTDSESPLTSVNTSGEIASQELKSSPGVLCGTTQRKVHGDVTEDGGNNEHRVIHAHSTSLLPSIPLDNQSPHTESGDLHENDLQIKVPIKCLDDDDITTKSEECSAYHSGLLSPSVGVNFEEMSESQIQDDTCLMTDQIKQADEGLKVDRVSVHRVIGKAQQQGPWRGVDPVLILKNESLIRSLVSFYGITDSFPLHGHLVTRSDDTSRLKRIYYVAQPVSDVIQLNLRAGEQLKITSAGLKLFERHSVKEGSSPCSFRIASEGLPVLLPFITKQRVSCSKRDFMLLLSSRLVSFGNFHDTLFDSAVQNLLPGCCVIELASDPSDEPIHSPAEQKGPTAIGCWRGRTNLSLLVTKLDAEQMLERLSLTEVQHGLPEQLKEDGPLDKVGINNVQFNDSKG